MGKWHLGNDLQPPNHFETTYTLTGGARSYENPEMSRNGEIKKESGYLTDLITAQALQYLDQQTKDKPFFLTLGYLNPHTPYNGHPQKYYDLYKDTIFDSVGFEPPAPNALREKEYLKDPLSAMRRAAASVTALDDQLPKIQKKLLDKGLWENTLIVFTGDNGYLHGRHGLWSKGHASDPINMYEEVVQVPMIYSWPGRIPADTVRPELVSFYDFLPTICDLTQSPLPAGRNLPGRSYAPLVRNQPLPKNQPWQNLVFAQFRNTEMARDVYFKLILRNNGEGPNELYDLRRDPRERINLYDSPNHVAARDNLTAALQSWKSRL
jgi:choline-sulfatase